MRRRLFAIILTAAMFAGAAGATTVSTWSGAGPNACDGRCPLEWVKTHLTPEELAAVEAAGEPGPILVHPGDVFGLMTYFGADGPVAYRRRIVADLDRAEHATGWRFDGWSLVKLHACGNWAIIIHEERAPLPPPAAILSGYDVPPPVAWTGAGGGFWGGGSCGCADEPWTDQTIINEGDVYRLWTYVSKDVFVFVHKPWSPPHPPHPPGPPQIPLPIGAALLASAMLAMLVMRRTGRAGS